MTRQFLISITLLTFCIPTAFSALSTEPAERKTGAVAQTQTPQKTPSKEATFEQRLAERNHKKHTRLEQQLRLAKSVTVEHIKCRKRAQAGVKKEKFALFTNHLTSIEKLFQTASTYTKPEIQGLAYSLCEKQLNMIFKMVEPKALKALKAA